MLTVVVRHKAPASKKKHDPKRLQSRPKHIKTLLKTNIEAIKIKTKSRGRDGGGGGP